MLGGHLDTVPVADNLPARLVDGRLYGLGSCDMKGGVAVALRLAATVPEPGPRRDVLLLRGRGDRGPHNGLRRLVENRPELLAGDFAVLMEPSGAGVEAGCQGTLRAEVRTVGPACAQRPLVDGEQRDPRGGDVLDRLRPYVPREPEVDGLRYREGLNAVRVARGRRGQRHPGRVHGHGELPLRARPLAGRGRGARPRGVRRASR